MRNFTERREFDELLAIVEGGDPVANLYIGRLYHKEEGAKEAKEDMTKKWDGKRQNHNSESRPSSKKSKASVLVDGKFQLKNSLRKQSKYSEDVRKELQVHLFENPDEHSWDLQDDKQ